MKTKSIVLESLIFIIIFSVNQKAYAVNFGDDIKQKAVWAVGKVSSDYSQKLNNINITQTIKNTAGSVVGTFSGPDAGNVVSNGTWKNALTTTSGAMTAGKVIASTVLGAGTSAIAGTDFGKSAGTAIYNTNIIQTVSNINTNFVTPKVDTFKMEATKDLKDWLPHINMGLAIVGASYSREYKKQEKFRQKIGPLNTDNPRYNNLTLDEIVHGLNGH